MLSTRVRPTNTSTSPQSTLTGSGDQLSSNSKSTVLFINNLRNLLLLIAIFLFIWLIGIPLSVWLFAVHSNNSDIIDEIKMQKLIRNEIEKYLNEFQLICKANKQCVTNQNYVSKSDHENDIQRILEKCTSSFFSWFDNGKKMKFMIDEALRKHDSDNIALADYALESVGGSVLVEYSSKTFTNRSPTFNILGIPVLKRTITPNIILRKGLMPGHCWPMFGSQGHVIINLAFPVRPKMFTLEHLPKTLSFDGQTRSAPKQFSVRGLNSVENEGEFLGRFTYDTITIGSSHIQSFEISPKNDLIFYRFIKLSIESNWGHPEFTCVYRFRVHGLPELPLSY